MSCPATEHSPSDLDRSPLAAALEPLERQLLNEFQRNLPLAPNPFGVIAGQLDCSEAWVVETLARFRELGLISRVGPVFRPNRVGNSTLAAMAVPEERLEEVAELINGFPEVNHNYQREHHFNLWFVVTAPDQPHLDHVLHEMEQQSGLPLLSLPMIEAYHLDLGFRLDWGDSGDAHSSGADVTRDTAPTTVYPTPTRPLDSEQQRRLVALIQDGLALTRSPYAEIASELGCDERQLLGQLQVWLNDGTINRIGVVVRHRELGYRANAMVVWDLPDDEVAETGRCIGQFEFVNLCYQRPRRLPQWRYNLFCMIHGQDRNAVMARVEALAEHCGLQRSHYQVLFSTRRFKQRGARYQRSDADEHQPCQQQWAVKQ